MTKTEAMEMFNLYLEFEQWFEDGSFDECPNCGELQDDRGMVPHTDECLFTSWFLVVYK